MTPAKSPLLDAANRQVYRANAFRLTGLDVDASARDVHKHLEKLQLALKADIKGKQAPGVLPLNPPPDAGAIRHAAQQLRDPEVRLIHELFWFWPASGSSSQTDEVLAMLRQGKIREASQAWLQAEHNGNDRLVASHNLAVIYHVYALDGALSSELRPTTNEQAKVLVDQSWWALTRWAALVRTDAFWAWVAERISSLDDPRLTSGMAAELREQFPLAICATCVDAAVAAAEAGQYDHAASLVNLLGTAGFEEQVRTTAARQATAPVLVKLQALCDESSATASKEIDKADIAVSHLIERASPLLGIMKAVRPSDVETEGAHDRVASCGMGSLVSFANKTKRWPRAVELTEKLSEIALGETAVATVSGNLEALRANAKHAVLQGRVGPVLELIDEIMGRQPVFLQFSLLKEKAWGRVSELQATFGATSEEFCKAADTLAEALRSVSVDFINEFHNWSLASEAFNLAIMVARSQEICTRLAEDRTTLDALRPQSSCFIATAAYGSPLVPEVSVLQEYRDAVLVPSPLGRIFVRFYYRVSPPLAKLVASSPMAASTVRTLLAPVVRICRNRLEAHQRLAAGSGSASARRKVCL